MKRTVATLLFLSLVSSCATAPTFAAQPSPRCGDLESFVKAVQVVGLNHVVLRGEQIDVAMEILSSAPNLDIVTRNPDHILVVMDRFENRAFLALVKNGIICDRIVVPVPIARRFMAGA